MNSQQINQQSQKPIPSGVRAAVMHAILRESQKSPLPLAKVTPILRAAKVEWREYAQDTKPGALKRWLTGNFPFDIANDTAGLITIRPNPNMDDALRERIASALGEAISDGSAKITDIPDILSKTGVRLADCSRPAERSPKEWLLSNFAEFQVYSDGISSYVRMYPAEAPPDKIEHKELTPDIRRRIMDSLSRAALESGGLLLSAVPDVLNENGVAWREYAKELQTTLKTWLREFEPQLAIPEQRGAERLYAEGQPVRDESEKAEPGEKPKAAPGDERALELERLHGFAYMRWGDIVSDISEKTGRVISDGSEWRTEIARRFAIARLEGALYESADGSEPISAFDTRLTDTRNRPLYMVFTPNTNATAAQFWAYQALCAPGEGAYGRQILSRFALPFSKPVESAAADAIKSIESLYEITESSKAAAQSVYESADKGFAPGADDIGIIAEYARAWDELCEKWAVLTPGEDARAFSLAALKRKAEDFANSRGALRAAAEKLASIADKTSDFLMNEHLIEVGSNDSERIAQALLNVDNGAKTISGILSVYERLCAVMNAKTLTEPLAGDLESVCAHFSMDFRPANRILVNNNDLPEIDETAAARAMLDDWEAENRRKPSYENFESADKTRESEIVKIAFAGTKEDTAQAVRRLIRPLNAFERLLIAASFGEALELAADEAKMAAEGYSAETAQEICKRLSCGGLPGRLSEFDCAQRLRAIQGNIGRQAERFMLLANRTEKSVNFLLDLYRSECREYDFSHVYRVCSMDYGISWENSLHMLTIYGKNGKHEGVLALLSKKPELGYEPESLFYVVNASNEVGDSEKAAKYAQRLERLSIHHEVNELERALIQNDQTTLALAASDPESLKGMGYDDRECALIRLAVQGGDYPGGVGDDSVFETGERILAVQGAKNGLAERYLWRGITEQSRGAQLGVIMGLLADGERWDECVDLYNAYPADIEQQKVCRTAYFRAILRIDSAAAVDMGKKYITDFLQGGFAPDLIASAQKCGQYKLAERLECLTTAIQSDYERAAAFMRPELRDFMLNADLLARHGLSAADSERVVATYKNDAYPHGRSCLDTAKRVYAFCRNTGGLARKFALAALPDMDSAVFLCEILKGEGDAESLLALFDEMPALKTEIPDDYADALFIAGDYERFIKTEPAKGARRAAAELSLGGAIPDIGEIDIARELEKPGDLLLLARSLAARGEQSAHALLNIMIRVFASDPAAFGEEALIETARALEAVYPGGIPAAQKTAHSIPGGLPFAVYCHTALGADGLKDEAKRYFGELIKTAAGESGEAPLAARTAAMLFPAEKSEIGRFTASARLKSAIEQGSLAEIEAALSCDERPDKQTFLAAVNLLASQKALLHAPFYALAARIGGEYGAEYEILRLLLNEFNSQSQDDTALHEFLAEYILNSISECGDIPRDLLTSCEAASKTLIRSLNSSIAAMCAYRAYKALGNESYAKMAVLYMLGCPHDERCALDADEIRWAGDPGALFDIFIDLAKSGHDALYNFAADCACFVRMGDAERRMAMLLEDAQLSGELTREDGSTLLRLLLCEPGRLRNWAACLLLPVDETKPEYIQILFFSARQNMYLWGECARFCEETLQWEMLVDALVRWQETCPPQTSRAVEFQKYIYRLTERLELSECAGDEALSRLTSELFDSAKAGGYKHESLRTAAAVAVSAKREIEAIRQMGAQLTQNGANIGSAMAATMLIKGRADEAWPLIESLDDGITPFSFKPLISSIRADGIEKARKLADDAAMTGLLKMALPDGNRPSYDMIKEYAIKSLHNGTQFHIANVLTKLADVFPSDPAVRAGMWLALREPVQGALSMLDKCLEGLCASLNEPYVADIRDKTTLLKLLCVVKCAGIACGELSMTYDTARALVSEVFRARLRPTVQEIYELNEFFDYCRRYVENAGGDELRLACLGMTACATGDWRAVISELYAKNSGYDACLDMLGAHSLGLSRSVIRLHQSMDSEEQKAFIKWLESASISAEGDDARRASAKQALFKARQAAGYVHGYRSAIGDDIDKVLTYPLEEKFIFEDIFESVFTPDAGSAPRERAYLIGLLQNDKRVAVKLTRTAHQAYMTGDISVAAGLYDTLRIINTRHSMYAGVLDRKSENTLNDARMNVAGFLAGVPQMVENVTSASLDHARCINAMMQLLGSPHARHWPRFRAALIPDNKALADAVLLCLNPDKTDDEKLQAAKGFPAAETRALLYMILRFDSSKAYFMRSDEKKNEAHNAYLHAVSDVRQSKDAKFPPTLVINKAVLQYIHLALNPETQKEAPAEPQKSAGGQSQELIAPEFIERAKRTCPPDSGEPRPTGEIERLIGSLKHDDYEPRRALLYEMYLSAKNGGDKKAEDDTALRLGMEEYARLQVLSRQNPDARKLARETLFEAAALSEDIKRLHRKSPVRDRFISFAPHALKELFIGGYISLNEALDSFRADKRGFESLRAALSEPEDAEAAEHVYAVLEQAVAARDETRSSPDALSARLSTAYGRLGDARASHEWASVFGSLQALIVNEINALNKRPMLSTHVLNEGGEGTFDGSLFGVVDNIGAETAYDLTIQAMFESGEMSAQYTLSHLYPHTQAAFELEYLIRPDEASARYTVTVSYTYQNASHSAEPCAGTLKIVPMARREALLKPYDTLTIVNYHPDESGDVRNDKFFGRQEEKRQLRALFEGDFVDWRDTRIIGVRRAGKSSLLNYTVAYLESQKAEALPILIDCQKVTEGRCVQYVFVEQALYHISRKLPGIAETTQWIELERRWSLPNDGPDRDPVTLERFYGELVPLLGGKKLVILLDEIDTLFEKVAQIRGLDNSLFPALGEFFGSFESRKIVHFLLCGSNHMLRYELDGGTLTQVFQRLNFDIRVGNLRPGDLRDMLTQPCGSDTFTYSQKAIEMIEHFTGGIVWHSKLLGNLLIDRLNSRGRNVVYPSDVCSMIMNIVDDSRCRQFGEACAEKEFAVLDVIQSLAPTVSSDVPQSRIEKLLEGEYDSAAVTRALGLLCKLELIKRLPVGNEPRYRFTQEIYRLYFRSMPSRFDRVPGIEYVFTQKPAESTAMDTFANLF